MKIRVNLARRIYLGRRPVLVGYGIIMLLLAAWLFTTLRYMVVTHDRSFVVADQLRQLEPTSEAGEPLPATLKIDPQRLAAEIAASNEILEMAKPRWVGLLDRLEELMVPGIQLRSLTPDFPGGQLRLELAARDPEALAAFLTSLQGYGPNSKVRLLSQMLQAPGADQPPALMCRVELQGGL